MRYVCVHGHFYQPPRENPWLEAVEKQDSAYPYHDWNQRITAECYAPNAASRILDHEKCIIEIVNNYSSISFNFGPTLLSWLKKNDPETYRAVLLADKKSQARFSSHGSALAQAYNHIIMPLANRRDKITQVYWGIRDFEHRFKRRPEGLWLPETAVDLETLEILADQGIKFTILAPHQAKPRQNLDPKQSYRCVLPSGRSIELFFYDGPISQELAFGRLLANGENFAHRLLGVFSAKSDQAQFVHVATDGETYGHHHRYGEMALSYCLYHLEKEKSARITIYGEYLAKHPPRQEVEIIENSSWSCAHGVERWQADCGCCTGQKMEWNQAWRRPLREALNWLRDQLIPIYEQEMSRLVKDPWLARNDYIELLLDNSYQNIEKFFFNQARHYLSEAENVQTLKLLETQKAALFMFTSCGWFFDELSGLETVQIMSYAARALELAQETSGVDLEEEFLNRLARAQSNLPSFGDGRQIYERLVKPRKLARRHDEQQKALAELAQPAVEEARQALYEIFERHRRTMAGLVKLSMPLPPALFAAARFVLTDQLQELLSKDLDLVKLKEKAALLKDWPLELRKRGLNFQAAQQLSGLMRQLAEQPGNLKLLSLITGALEIFLTPPLSLELDLWQAQNYYFEIGKEQLADMDQRARSGEETASQWLKLFTELGGFLRVKIK